MSLRSAIWHGHLTMCLSSSDKEKEKLKSRQLEEHVQGNHVKHTYCATCPIPDGPVVRHKGMVHETQGECKCVAYVSAKPS